MTTVFQRHADNWQIIAVHMSKARKDNSEGFAVAMARSPNGAGFLVFIVAHRRPISRRKERARMGHRVHSAP